MDIQLATCDEFANFTEVRLSNCEFGCKIYLCSDCGVEYVFHSSVYGHSSPSFEEVRHRDDH